MKSIIVTVTFEYTDAHMSITDEGKLIDDIETRCINLCYVFDFEYQLDYKRIDDTPHLCFSISFSKDILTFQHYMNVLAAFAQEFQINIANAYEEEV